MRTKIESALVNLRVTSKRVQNHRVTRRSALCTVGIATSCVMAANKVFVMARSKSAEAQTSKLSVRLSNLADRIDQGLEEDVE